MNNNLLCAMAGSAIIASTGSTAFAAAVSGQGTWETTLHGRDLDGNISTFEAYYDTVLDVTWMADLDYAFSSGYDDDGQMTWYEAVAWADSLDPYGSGVTGWRLPNTGPVNGSTYNYTYKYDGTTDDGYNISSPGTLYAGSTGSEMAHMFYNTLGNVGSFDVNGNEDPEWNFGIVASNAGPFRNGLCNYWSSTELAIDADGAWMFDHCVGSQSGFIKTTDEFRAWAVHDGDVGASVVPIPATVWLFTSGALGLLGISRKVT